MCKHLNHAPPLPVKLVKKPCKPDASQMQAMQACLVRRGKSLLIPKTYDVRI